MERPEDKTTTGSDDGGRGRSVAETGRDFLHAVLGGLLIGLPLLWTSAL